MIMKKFFTSFSGILLLFYLQKDRIFKNSLYNKIFVGEDSVKNMRNFVNKNIQLDRRGKYICKRIPSFFRFYTE